MNTQFILIRHAPAAKAGYLHGRSDVAAVLPATPRAAPWDGAALHLVSPAQRCRATAQYLNPDAAWQVTPALWEQDFGAWDGLPYAEIPDLGPLSRADLARHRPPAGESFTDLIARVRPVFLADHGAGQVVIVAHAGVIRAALSLALGHEDAGLAFTIDPLSQTRLSRHGNDWAITCVNQEIL